MKTISIYIHIPFCIKKCSYCDFLSFPNYDDFYTTYVDRLVDEIGQVSLEMKQFVVKTIFIGGGTPSILSPILIEKIVRAIKINFSLCNDLEFTIESNPGTLNDEILQCYKQLGINRLSIGLQATQDNLLNELGRIHTFQQFVDNYLTARKIGIKNINIDLMFSLPNQTKKDWEESLDTVILLNPEHISTYSLTIEQNTPFALKQKNNELNLPSDELDRYMYSIAKDKLKSAGYDHYEISNFAKENYKCNHNMVYWNCNDYIGIGLGAHSLFKDIRYNNTTNLKEYMSGFNNFRKNIFLNTNDKYSDFMFMGLRLIDGVSEKTFFNRFNVHISDIYGAQLQKLLSLNLIKKEGDKYSLTDYGLDLSNIVFMEFIILN